MAAGNERPAGLGRVKMGVPEIVGGPGTHGVECIPIHVVDSIMNDVIAYVPGAVHAQRKERVVFLVDRLNADLKAAAEEAPAPAAERTAIQDELQKERYAATVLGDVARSAMVKLYDIIMQRGTPLNPLAALAQLEHAMQEAGGLPPPPPEGFEDAVREYATIMQAKQWPSGHAPLPPEGNYPPGGVERREFPSMGVLYRSREPGTEFDGKTREGDSFKSPDEQKAAEAGEATTQGREDRREHNPGLGVEYRQERSADERLRAYDVMTGNVGQQASGAAVDDAGVAGDNAQG